jgi:hypothetical protein
MMKAWIMHVSAHRTVDVTTEGWEDSAAAPNTADAGNIAVVLADTGTQSQKQ